MSVTLAEWADLLEKEYLSDFIPSGGAAVKIVLAPEEHVTLIHDSLRQTVTRQRGLLLHIDAAKTHVHQIEKIFFEAASQIDWDSLAESWLRKAFVTNGYNLKPEQPLSDLESIAASHGHGMRTGDVIAEVRRWVVNDILLNYRLGKEFRTAMAMLCQAAINPRNVSPDDADIVKQWLCGEKASLTALKRLQIYQRIARHNARLQLNSLAIWLHMTGYGSTVLLLDTAHVMKDIPARMVPIRYTRGATLDFYEVLRQFIDDIDETKYLLIVATSTPGMLEHPKKSVDNYTALKMRTVDDVRDRNRSNPLNALVQLEIN